MVAEQLTCNNTTVIIVDELWHHVEAVWIALPVHVIIFLGAPVAETIRASPLFRQIPARR